jgi:hypothetical protein
VNDCVGLPVNKCDSVALAMPTSSPKVIVLVDNSNVFIRNQYRHDPGNGATITGSMNED